MNELIKSALEPVLERAIGDHPENPREAILKINVLDPACGSGHFLLAAARRMAAEIARLGSDVDTSDETARQHALREIVQHCIYGVDRNPLAVELCKTALWIEAVEPGRPLAFLDAHVQCGDSLVGILDPKSMRDGIPSKAYEALTGDDKAVCTNLKKRNRQAGDAVQGDLFDEDDQLEVAIAAADLDDMPEETVDDVECKHAAWNAGRKDEPRIREALRANLFVGAFFARKTRGSDATVPLTEDLNRLDMNRAPRPGLEDAVAKLADQHRFFHWYLGFPEIMLDGGFDVVLGNPPWERIKLQEKEFFAMRSPRIADAPNKAARDELIRQLAHEDASPPEKTLYRAFEAAKHDSKATSQFVRTGGRFPLTGVRDVNTYAVFAETFLQLISPRGRAGLIVPTGIATGYSAKAFFDEIVREKRLVSLYDFENQAVFADVHPSYKFCLLTLCGNNHTQAEFAFFLHQVEQLREEERRFTLSPHDLALLNPNTRTCPIFRTRRDMEIARKMYQRAGVLWKEAGDNEPEADPWGVTFQRMFDMSNDSRLFRTRTQLTEEGWALRGNVFVRGKERYLPLYEGKLFHQYDHRFATFDGVSKQDIRKGKTREMTPEEKQSPETVVIPRYWVSEHDVLGKLDNLDRRVGGSAGVPMHPRRAGTNLSLRDIAGSTNKRTGIAAMIPRESGASGTASLLHIDGSEVLTANLIRTVEHSALAIDHGHARASGLVLANMNSLPLDWAARSSVGGTHMSFFIVEQLPVLPPEAYLDKAYRNSVTYAELVLSRVLELTYTAHDLQGFARDLGYDGPPFPWDERRRHRLMCELDAIYAHMYHLERPDVEWILDAELPSCSFPTLKRNEVNEFGEYRTQRYVLSAYDQLQRGEIPNLERASA